jgi:hypothetical protein
MSRTAGGPALTDKRSWPKLPSPSPKHNKEAAVRPKKTSLFFGFLCLLALIPARPGTKENPVVSAENLQASRFVGEHFAEGKLPPFFVTAADSPPRS